MQQVFQKHLFENCHADPLVHAYVGAGRWKPVSPTAWRLWCHWDAVKWWHRKVSHVCVELGRLQLMNMFNILILFRRACVVHARFPAWVDFCSVWMRLAWMTIRCKAAAFVAPMKTPNDQVVQRSLTHPLRHDTSPSPDSVTHSMSGSPLPWSSYTDADFPATARNYAERGQDCKFLFLVRISLEVEMQATLKCLCKRSGFGDSWKARDEDWTNL